MHSTRLRGSSLTGRAPFSLRILIQWSPCRVSVTCLARTFTFGLRDARPSGPLEPPEGASHLVAGRFSARRGFWGEFAPCRGDRPVAHGHQVKPAAWGKPSQKLAAGLAWGSKPQAGRPQGARSTLDERSIAPTACQHMWIVASGLAPDACVARKGRRYFSSGWPGCLLST